MHKTLSIALSLLTLWVALLTTAQAQTAPGAGFADPQGVAPRRAPPTELEPVYRGPSLDMLATIRKRGLLRVGIVASAPMVMHDRKGEPVGYSVDLAHRLAEDLGVQLQLVETSWNAVIPDLLAQQFDLIASGLWVSNARSLVVNFSGPTALEGVYLVAGKTAAAPRSVSEFNKPGITLAVYAGSTQARVAASLFPQARLLTVEGDADHLAPVLAGKAQAALVPTIAPQGLLRSAPDKLYLPQAAPLSMTRAAFALRKGDPDFLSYLNTWLDLQRDAGWLEARATYWSSSTDWLH